MSIVVAAAVIHEGRLLIAQRATPPELAGQWELPGGKVASGETEEIALRREVYEELGIEVKVGLRLGADIDLGPLTLRAYRADLLGGAPYPHEHLALQWIQSEELDEVEWVAADRAWVPALRQALL